MALISDFETTLEDSHVVYANEKEDVSHEMVKDVNITLLDHRMVQTDMIVLDMSKQYDCIIGQGDLLSFGITLTGLPNGMEPMKDQSDDNILNPPKPPTDRVKELIPELVKNITDLIVKNRAIKITQWAKFKFNNGYVSLDLSKVDFTQLKTPSRNYVSHRHMEEVTEQVKKWLDDGVIEVNYEPTPSNLALLAVDQFNSDGTFKKVRVCLDMSPINKIIPTHNFHLPRINEMLRSLGGATVFSKIDLTQGYHQLRILREHRKYFSFAWKGKQYMFRGAPFGLHMLPAFFQQIMDDLFADMPQVKVYLDDIIIFTATREEHSHIVRQVLARLNAHNFKINEAKCEWGVDKVQLLGYVVSGEGIEIDPGKVEHLLDWRTPTTGKDVNSLCGFVNFFTDGVPHLADLLKPFGHLRLHKGKLDELWTAECEEAFRKVKTAVQSAPVMRRPIDGKPFKVATDASDNAVGGVLYQVVENKPRYVQFFSKSLNASQRNYPTVKQELLAIVSALEHFKDYLYGTHFKVACDQKSLVYLNDMKPHNQLVSRWHDRLCQFSFTIEHIPGIHNHLPDMLSRLLPDYQKTVRELLATDWKLNPRFFQLAEEKWGKHTIDMFAAAHNAQLPDYRTPNHPKGDAFEINLKKHNAWANPPWQLIKQLLNYVNIQEATITLCCPLRKTDSWYTDLVSMIQEEPIYIDRKVDTFLYMGTRAVKKTPWLHTIVCRIGPKGTSTWKPSEAFQRKVDESTTPLETNYRDQYWANAKAKAQATKAKSLETTRKTHKVCVTALHPSRERVIADKFHASMKSLNEEAKTQMLAALKSDWPGVYEQLMKLVDNYHVYTRECSGKQLTAQQPDTREERLSANPVDEDMGINTHLEASSSQTSSVEPITNQGVSGLELRTQPDVNITASTSDDDALKWIVDYHNLTHSAADAMIAEARRRGLINPNLRKLCEQEYEKCEPCEKNQIKRYGWAPLKAVIEDEPMRRVIIDLVAMDEVGRHDEKYIFHMFDVASRYNLFYAVRNKLPETMAELCLRIFADHGYPLFLCHDNGGEFVGDIMATFKLVSGICEKRGVPYKPQTQGANEVRHRKLKFLLRTALKDDASKWPFRLTWVQDQMNETPDPVTGVTPSHYFRGRKSVLQPHVEGVPEKEQSLKWLERLDRIHKVVYPTLREKRNVALLKAQERWSKKKKQAFFKEGDIVNIRQRNSDTGKLYSYFIGPYVISVHDEKSDTYEVNNVEGSSALNMGLSRIPVDQIQLCRTYKDTTPLEQHEFKKIIGIETINGITYYKTLFYDNEVYNLTSADFGNPDYLKSVNKKWRKRLHKNKEDKDKLFPKADMSAKHSYPGLEFWTSLYRERLPKSMLRKRDLSKGGTGVTKRLRVAP